MPPLSFHEWLGNRPEEAPDVGRLALAIARAGPAGVSLEDLARAVGVPRETVQDILRALVTAGQVEVVRVNGNLVYRAAG